MTPRDRTAQREKVGGKRRGRHADTPHVDPQFWLKSAVLILIPLLLYLPALRGEFVWDDDTHLTANLLTQPGGLYRTWFTSHQPNYWPLTWSAFWIQWKAFGMNPLGYHVTNLLLHALNGFLVWRVLGALAIPGAWAAALIFAVHPVNTEAAVWITQLKTLLCLVLYLLSILAYLRARQLPDALDAGWYGKSLLLFVAALLSKPAVVMLPVVLLLIAWWQNMRITKKDLVLALPYFAVAGIISLTEIWFQSNRSMAGMNLREDTLVERLAGSGWVVCFYLWKLLIPHNLTLVYPRWDIHADQAETWLPLILFLGLMSVSFWKRHSWGRHLFLGIGYFAVTLFPVLGFFNIYFFRYSFVADHWQYQSMIGPVALIVAIAATLLSRLGKNAMLVQRISLVVVVGILAALSFRHQFAFRSLESLYLDTIRKNDQASLAHSNLGSLYYRQGKLAEARKHLDKAMTIDPTDPEPNAVLANLVFDEGKYQEALALYERALPRMPPPDKFKIHFEMAQTYLRLGQKAEAAASLRKVLELRPGLVPAKQLLSELEQGQP